MGMNHAPTILLFVHEGGNRGNQQARNDASAGYGFWQCRQTDDGRRTTDRHDRAGNGERDTNERRRSAEG